MFVIGDTHFGRMNDIVWDGMLTNRLRDTKARVCEVIDKAAQAGESVVIVGDLFDSPNPKPIVLVHVFDIFNRAMRQNVPMYIISGNHDCGVDYSALMAGAGANFQNVHFITEIETMPVDGITCAFLPHLPAAEVVGGAPLADRLREGIAGSGAKILFTHAHVYGAKNSSDVEIEAGNAIDLRPETFPQFDLVVCGHIHKAQVINDKYVYTGSVIPCDYSECEDYKSYIRIQGMEWEHYPFETKIQDYKHVTVDLVTKDSVEFPDAKMKKLIGGKLVKVTVFTNDLSKVDEYELRKAFNKHGQVTRFEVVLEKDNEEAPEIEDTKVSYEDMFSEWLASRDEKADVKKLALVCAKEVIGGIHAEADRA